MTLTIADVTPQQAFDRFEHLLGLTNPDLTAAFGVSSRTLTRWRKAEAHPQHEVRVKINQLLELTDMLSENFTSDEAAKEWMHSESRYLGGLTPAEAVRGGRTDGALAALEALESGIHL